ncbi:MAG: hypothetical protein ACO25B_08230 [Chitinophagaceae bacterium]
MKKRSLIPLLALILLACNNKKGIPDVSGIRVEIPINRFDRDFFRLDTNQLSEGLQELANQQPGFYGDFMHEVLGVSGQPGDSNTLLVTRLFIRGYSAVYDSLVLRFDKTEWLKNELEQAFRYVKYYFPSYKTGPVTLFVGPFDAPGVASASNGIAVGLQQFAGADFSIYQAPQMQEIFPLYISRRFSPKYITANCMKAVVLELFPDQSTGKPLVEQMVEKGKQWYLLDQFLPRSPDSVKTGFTGLQLRWCEENEGLIWSDILRNEDLNSLNPVVIQNYIGEGPFTQGFSQEYSPGNLGQWIGWRIIRKFLSKNPDLKPEDIMRIPARKILEEAKYKPR